VNSFAHKIQRFNAVEGASAVVNDTVCLSVCLSVAIVGTPPKISQYSRKATTPGIKKVTPGGKWDVPCLRSQVALWKELVAAAADDPSNSNQTMLILINDAVFTTTSSGGKSRFAAASAQAWKQLAVDDDWGIILFGSFGSTGTDLCCQ
jgi:hypothetical protein